MSIVLDKDYKNKTVEVKRFGDSIIVLKLILGNENKFLFP